MNAMALSIALTWAGNFEPGQPSFSGKLLTSFQKSFSSLLRLLVLAFHDTRSKGLWQHFLNGYYFLSGVPRSRMGCFPFSRHFNASVSGNSIDTHRWAEMGESQK